MADSGEENNDNGANVVPNALERQGSRRALALWVVAAVVILVGALVVLLPRRPGTLTPTTLPPQPSVSTSVTPSSVPPSSVAPSSSAPSSTAATAPPASTSTPAGSSTDPDTAQYPSEDSGLGGCGDSGRCDQVVFGGDGTPVAYSSSNNTLTVFSTTGDIEVAVPPSAVSPWLIAYGPDNLVYMWVQGANDKGDLIVVDPSGGTFNIVSRKNGIIDSSGDTDYVPTARGLVEVGCCDFTTPLPQPDAKLLIEWSTTSATLNRTTWNRWSDAVTFRPGPPANELAVTRETPSGTRSWTITGLAGWQPRGMPLIAATYDGGFVAALPNDTDSFTFAVRGDATGGTKVVQVPGSAAAVDPMGRVYTGPDFTTNAAGGPVVVNDVFAADRPNYNIAKDVQPGGAVEFPGLNDRLKAGEIVVDDPVQLAVLINWGATGAPDVNERVTVDSTTQADGTTVVTVTTSNLYDDSGAAVRGTYTISAAPYTVVSAEETWRCQPGRGHQDFNPEPCN